jgi:hypothetical protein
MIPHQGGFDMRRSLLLIALSGASLLPCVAATDGVPRGWHLAGTQPQSYTSGSDGNGTAFLASRPDSNAAGFGTMMQSIRADEYRGKRVRFSAFVRSEDVAEWAGLWMRVDEGSSIVSFDNMQNRPIKGTTAWNTYEVVLDVSPAASTISFGALVASSGGVWVKHPSLEVVGANVPTTGAPYPKSGPQWWIKPQAFPERPQNLDLKE